MVLKHEARRASKERGGRRISGLREYFRIFSLYRRLCSRSRHTLDFLWLPSFERSVVTAENAESVNFLRP